MVKEEGGKLHFFSDFGGGKKRARGWAWTVDGCVARTRTYCSLTHLGSEIENYYDAVVVTVR